MVKKAVGEGAGLCPKIMMLQSQNGTLAKMLKVFVMSFFHRYKSLLINPLRLHICTIIH